MPKLTIDGVEYEAQDGQTIIEVCDQHHLNVPRFCYHPGLTVAGNCRICLVDVEKAPKPQIACGTPVAEGMVVHTDNDRAKWARQGVMEFLLLNHPLDCPICDKAGECMLQWFSVEHGPGRSRLVGEKEHFAKKLDIGEHIVLDQERCILCSRCVRFTDEITKTHELAITERGVRAELNVVEGRRLDNAYSGCVTDICPVGALTLKEFRFKSRVWFLKDTASICPGCSRGCNVNVSVNTNMNVHGGRIERLLPRTNTAVNDYWMCDTGRLIFRDLYDKPRLRVPQVRDGGALRPVSWDDAAGAVWKRLREAADKGGPGSVAFVLSARATNEEIFLLRRLLGDLGSEMLAFPEHVEGVDDGLLLNADRTPNRRGALEIAAPPRSTGARSPRSDWGSSRTGSAPCSSPGRARSGTASFPRRCSTASIRSWCSSGPARPRCWSGRTWSCRWRPGRRWRGPGPTATAGCSASAPRCARSARRGRSWTWLCGSGGTPAGPSATPPRPTCWMRSRRRFPPSPGSTTRRSGCSARISRARRSPRGAR